MDIQHVVTDSARTRAFASAIEPPAHHAPTAHGSNAMEYSVWMKYACAPGLG